MVGCKLAHHTTGDKLVKPVIPNDDKSHAGWTQSTSGWQACLPRRIFELVTDKIIRRGKRHGWQSLTMSTPDSNLSPGVGSKLGHS